MFETHFGVTENPFHALSDPKDIFASSELNEAVQHFFFARGNRDAIMLLTGEVGTGKTTAIRAICRQLPDKTPLAVIEHGPISPQELIDELFRAYRLRRKPTETVRERMQRFKSALERFVKAGRRPVLILDEAHLLDDSVLEEVRLLTNLRHGGHPMVQVFLVGQEELADRLREHALRPLRQRISVRYTMKPLSREETTVYLVDRLKGAGSEIPERVFEHAAACAVHELSSGIPREINVLAGQAMLNAYIDNDRIVREKHVRTAIEHYGFEGAALVPPVPAPAATPAPVQDTLPEPAPDQPTIPEPAPVQPTLFEPMPESPPENDAPATPEPKLQPGAPTTVPISDHNARQLITAIAIVCGVLILGALFLWSRASGGVARGNPTSPEVASGISPVRAPTPTATPEPRIRRKREPSSAEPVGANAPWAPASLRGEGSSASAAQPREAAQNETPKQSMAERFPSSLEISSSEPAEVWLDDKRLGMAPGHFAPIAPGRYQIRLDAGDGRVFEKDVVVTLGSTTYINASTFSR